MRMRRMKCSLCGGEMKRNGRTKAGTQRCLYHVFCQIRRMTTSRPNLPAGQELYVLAKDLLHISTDVEAKI